MTDIVFGPESQDINVYAWDSFKLNLRVLGPDSNNYINTGSWNFYFFNKETGNTIDTSPTGISANPNINEYTNKNFLYKAIAGFTGSFSGVDQNGQVLSYVENFLEVYKNDVLIGSENYTASNGISVVFNTGAEINDMIKIVSVDSILPTGVTEIFVSSSVTGLLAATASVSDIKYEFYIDTETGKYTFLKGNVDVSSRFEE